MTDSTTNVQVAIRIRPLTNNYHQGARGNSLAQDESIRRCISMVSDDKKVLTLDKLASGEQFTFDYVADEATHQSEIFDSVGKSIVDACLQGYNGSIFAYGQTGSGKTFTIQGQGSENSKGLLPRAFEYLFHEMQIIRSKHAHACKLGKPLQTQSPGKSLYNQDIFNPEKIAEIEFEVKCTCIEIYNETIYDLLDPNGQTKLQIREDKGTTFLERCTESHASNLKELTDIIKRGMENRHVACTNMNLESSRSHAVFTAYISTLVTQRDSKKVVRTSRFHIVDLAGSERVKDTNADGQRLKELCKINNSLSVLGKVIYQLSENCKLDRKQQGFINFRESKLTHLLKDSLGGNSKTVMVCTLNPHMNAIKETISTLKFAQRAKMIRQKPVINEENNNAEYWKAKFNELLKKVSSSQELPCQIQSSSPTQSWNQLLTQLKQKDTQLQEAHLDVKRLVLTVKDLTSDMEQQQAGFKHAQDRMQLFRSQLNFRLKIAQGKEAVLLSEKFQRGSASNEAECLNQIIQDQNQEIIQLKQLVEANPLLASSHAKINDLELQLRLSSDRSDISVVCNDVLVRLERVLRAHETYQSEIALLENGLHNSSKLDDPQMDCEMLDAEHALSSEEAQRRFYEGKIAEMQARITKLEVKNKEYLELLCGTQNSASTNEATMPQLLCLIRANQAMVSETSQEALDLFEETLNDLAAKYAQIEYMKDELIRWKTSDESMRVELDSLKQQLLGSELRTNSREHEFKELELKVKTLEFQNASALETNVELEDYKQRLVSVSSELAQRQAELEGQQRLVDCMEKVYNELRGSLSTAQQQVQVSDLKLATLEADIKSLKQAQLDASGMALDAQIERQQAENARLHKELRTEKEKTDGLTEQCKGYLGSISELSQQLGQQKDLHAMNEKQLRGKCEMLEEAQIKIDLLEKQADDLMRSNEQFQRAIADIQHAREGLNKDLATYKDEAALKISEQRITIEGLLAVNQAQMKQLEETSLTLRAQVDQQALAMEQERKQASHLIAIIRAKNEQIDALVREANQRPQMEASLAEDVQNRLQQIEQIQEQAHQANQRASDAERERDAALKQTAEDHEKLEDMKEEINTKKVENRQIQDANKELLERHIKMVEENDNLKEKIIYLETKLKNAQDRASRLKQLIPQDNDFKPQEGTKDQRYVRFPFPKMQAESQAISPQSIAHWFALQQRRDEDQTDKDIFYQMLKEDIKQAYLLKLELKTADCNCGYCLKTFKRHSFKLALSAKDLDNVHRCEEIKDDVEVEMILRGLHTKLRYSKASIKDAWLNYLGTLTDEQKEELKGLKDFSKKIWKRERGPKPSGHQRGHREKELE